MASMSNSAGRCPSHGWPGGESRCGREYSSILDTTCLCQLFENQGEIMKTRIATIVVAVLLAFDLVATWLLRDQLNLLSLVGLLLIAPIVLGALLVALLWPGLTARHAAYSAAFALGLTTVLWLVGSTIDVYAAVQNTESMFANSGVAIENVEVSTSASSIVFVESLGSKKSANE